MTKECLVCNKTFKKSKNVTLLGWEKTKFCSVNCHNIDQRNRRDFSKYVRNCEFCNESFTVKKPSVKGRFCSKTCFVRSCLNVKRPCISGVRHWNWAGGKTKEQETIRKSTEYKQWRESVFKRDKFTCVVCGDFRGGNLEADHIKPFSTNPKLRFSVDNGRTLCHKCHVKTDSYLKGSVRNIKTGRYVSNFI